MIRPPLPAEVLARYGTDKNGQLPDAHSYGRDFYNFYLPRYRWVNAVLEIGIDRGESLRAWREYFGDAHIYGVDCRRECLLHEDRIHSIHLDASSEHDLSLFAAEYADTFSFICDDGSHLLADQLLTVRVLKKALRLGGILVIEDVQTEENARVLAQEGMRVESWLTHLRADNRIAFLIKEEDS